MNLPRVGLDAYTFRTRLLPALLVLLPAGLAALAWFPELQASWTPILSLVVACGGIALLAQVGRDRGRAKEPMLYASWGGKPTTRLLRHRDAPNKVLLARRHAKLQELLSDVQIPTPVEEQADPAKADEVYDACVAFLIEKTRDRQRFPIVFDENCNYGFRRNLWGLKPIGIAVAAVSAALVGALIVVTVRVNRADLPALAVAAGGAHVAMLLAWVLWFTPDWVKATAEAYAERLLGSCDSL